MPSPRSQGWGLRDARLAISRGYTCAEWHTLEPRPCIVEYCEEPGRPSSWHEGGVARRCRSPWLQESVPNISAINFGCQITNRRDSVYPLARSLKVA